MCLIAFRKAFGHCVFGHWNQLTWMRSKRWEDLFLTLLVQTMFLFWQGPIGILTLAASWFHLFVLQMNSLLFHTSVAICDSYIRHGSRLYQLAVPALFLRVPVAAWCSVPTHACHSEMGFSRSLALQEDWWIFVFFILCVAIGEEEITWDKRNIVVPALERHFIMMKWRKMIAS